MKITKELDFQVVLKAVLDENDNLALSLHSTAPYGNRTATAVLETFSEKTVKEVKAVLKGVLAQYGEQAVLLAERAAAEAHTKAVALGEEI